MTDSTQSSPYQLRVFLCHASDDKGKVRNLYRNLQSEGFKVWLDEEDLIPGQNWEQEIRKAVRESDTVLVCLSNHSINKAGFIQREIKFALDVADEQPEGAIFIVPVKLEECEVPTQFSSLHWVNLSDNHKHGYKQLIRALVTRAATSEPGFAVSKLGQKSKIPAWLKVLNSPKGWAVSAIVIMLLSITVIALATFPNFTNSPSANPSQSPLSTPTDKEREEYLLNVQKYDITIKLNPNAAGSYTNRGWYHFMLGNYKQAFEDFDRAIELDPRSCGCHYRWRGWAYGELGQDQKAIDDYERAVNLATEKEDKSSWYYQLGLLYKKKGNNQEAKNAFQKAADAGNSDAKKELESLS